MFFEIVSLVIESLLALAAVIIAAIQLIGEIRERKAGHAEEEKRDKEKIKVREIVDTLEPLNRWKDEVVSSLSERLKESKSAYQKPEDTRNNLTYCIDKYKRVFIANMPGLEKVYRILLENEDSFPMSHGYSRYIDDLRDILNLESVTRKMEIAGYYQFCEKLEMIIEESNSPENSEYQELMDSLPRILEPIFEHSDRLSAVLRELSIKYPPRDEE